MDKMGLGNWDFDSINWSLNSINNETIVVMFASGLLGAIIAVGILLMILFFIAAYVYHALSWREIARKLSYKKSWLAWIPIANISLILELGGYHWAWVFLILIPIFGWIVLFIFVIVAIWRIFERRKYPGWFSLSMVIPKIGVILYLITIGFVAWKDKAGLRKATSTIKPVKIIRVKKVKKPVKRKVRKKK